ncbi:MAG: putative DNA modification/repair radical SAM protein [Oscillospiraceae bacterium]|nr:putative DNA modification/repair radical SAM protein [Oscillospiraceae bacterium]
MDIFEKLRILADAAKFDVACTSSGVDRTNKKGRNASGTAGIGSAVACGICHTFSADGRCVSLLKVLMTNSCIYDCKYCANRSSNDTKRVVFTPAELAEITINFYKRNYIEGLFLSSGVLKSPDYTCEQMIKSIEILRNEYNFRGYIHAKAIPGADHKLLDRLGLLADRMSVNIELPSQKSLETLAPDKSRNSVLTPMGYIRDKVKENRTDIVRYRHAPKFVPAGQSTQMIIGATAETDFQILTLTEALYNKYSLKRVFFSAYVPVADNPLLPVITSKPPLLREHRLYQADWLLRFYGFEAKELLDEQNNNFNEYVDPKCNWALNHLDMFPVDVNTAPPDMLLRVPGIGPTGAERIINARKSRSLDYQGLKKIGIVLKRAQYFIICKDTVISSLNISRDNIIRGLISERGYNEINQKILASQYEQLRLF